MRESELNEEDIEYFESLKDILTLHLTTLLLTVSLIGNVISLRLENWKKQEY